MSQRPASIIPWEERGHDAYRCQICGAAWVIDRDPEVDNEEMMTSQMREHLCFPGVTVADVDEVWQEAQRIAEELPAELGRGRLAEDITREEWARLCEEADLEHAAGETLALHLDCNAALLGTADVHIYCGGQSRWERIVGSAVVAARRALLSDEARARELASMVASGLPGAANAFRPQHARMARAMLPEMHARAVSLAEADGDRWPVPSIEEAADWLVRFEGEATAVL